MASGIYGTRSEQGKYHPVFDLAFWEERFPLGDWRREGVGVDSPGDLARVEQARRLARTHGDLGPSVPADVFVWADKEHDRPWLTRLGGRPWRPRERPWPRDENGIPYTFLGQICFADSHDVLPFKLPGDVVLFFGTWDTAWATPGVIEWSPLVINKWDGWGAPRGGELPFQYAGVVHRTAQYIDREAAVGPFEAAGFKEGGWGVRSVQATSVGTHASIPQGWPFEEGDGNTLVCTLSSFSFSGEWPLVNVPAVPQRLRSDGTTVDFFDDDALSIGIGDAGALYVYRDRHGAFHLDGAHS